MKSTTGFTKSECLVCLGCAVFVLANIAAIGNSGRKRAKEAVCLSNLRKWGVVFSQFAADNEGGTCEPFTREYMEVPPNDRGDWWFALLSDYYADANNLLLCPATTQPSSENRVAMAEFEYWIMGRVGEGKQIGSYTVNQWSLNPRPEFPMLSISGSLQILPNSDFWHRMDVAGADNIPLVGGGCFPAAWVFDFTPYGPGVGPVLLPEYRNTGNPGSSFLEMVASVETMTCFWDRHNGATNMVFMDTSARKFGLKQIWSFKWNRVWNTCNPYTACGGVGPSDWPDWMQDFTEPVP